MNDSPARRRHKLTEACFSVALPLMIFTALIAGLGFYVYDVARHAVGKNVAGDMRAISTLKTGQIQQWLQERRDDAQLIATSELSVEMELWLDGGMKNNVIKNHLLAQLRQFATTAHYSDISLRSAVDGKLLLTSAGYPDLPGVREDAVRAANLGLPSLEDFHFAESKSVSGIDIGFFNPVFGAKSGRMLAVLHITIDPGDVLFPLLQQWPGASKSAETLLVRRDGDDVLYLNMLRHAENAALRLRVPMSTPNFVAARLIKEGRGLFESNDYRGVPSFSYGLPVAGTSWFLVAKMDRKEAFAQFNAVAATTAAVLVMLLLACAWWLTERKQAEQAQLGLNRALRLLSNCNQTLIHARDEQTLLDAICQLAVATGGYRMAWIGFAVHDVGKTLQIASRFGHEEGYLDAINISWNGDEQGRGPTGTAIRTGKTQVNHDFQRNPLLLPWRDAALKCGYQSSISLPLAEENNAAFGALTIYSPVANAFVAAEVKLLEELADDLSFGIVALRSATARRQAEEGLRYSEERYRLVLENAADAVFVIHPDGRLVYVNQQVTRMLGYGVDELLSMSVADVVPLEEIESTRSLLEQLKAQGQMRAEMSLKCRDGSSVPVELNAVSLPDGNLYGACRDITERRRYEVQLEYQATHDTLTGLANRNLLTDRIEQSIANASRTGHWVAAMLLDIDRFKLINDSLGHATGDALLQEVAKRLSGCVRSGDTVARLGGDEFMVVLSDMSTEDGAAALARKLLGAVAQPIRAGQHEIVITASLGVSLYPRDGELAPTLFKNADVAMYRAKELGRNSFQFYAPEMNARVLERLELENGLRRALELDELVLYYQPKVDLSRGHVVGAEALIRWKHPIAGMISPADFIPLAEETGLIVPIGEWVIEAACTQIKAWQDQGLSGITVSVNLSARQFQQENLVQIVAQGLRVSGVQAQYLELEVTESAIMKNPSKTITILQQLKKIGVHISLDDFGTGYSSLNYLKRFPIDSLKIDQSFVRDITSDPDDAAIARMIITLAHSLKKKVIAEGVESEAQLNFLQREHCDEMQGYFFSRPVPAEDFADILRDGRSLKLAATPLEEMHTLLIVDDEANVISSLKRLLRPEGYTILTAGSAAEGLEMLALHPVQVIIADQRMPLMNGTEFLNRVWQMYPDTIRILLTGYTDLKSVTEAVNRGAILKFLTKPWEDELLREHVREAFRYYDLKKKAQQYYG